jgi:membrane associated rhomboid family serine protease
MARGNNMIKWNATLILIIINVLFFIATIILQYIFGDVVMSNVALQPIAILNGQKIWTIITSMFMHGGIMHLIVNMLSLFFIGTFLERLISKKRYIFIYLLSGIVASLFFVFLAAVFNQDLTLPAVGASGAIFGIGGVLAVLTPKVPIYILFIPIAMPMWLGLVIMLIVLWLISSFTGMPIGNTAHLGGFIAGLAYGFYLRMKYHRKIARLDSYFR